MKKKNSFILLFATTLFLSSCLSSNGENPIPYFVIVSVKTGTVKISGTLSKTKNLLGSVSRENTLFANNNDPMLNTFSSVAPVVNSTNIPSDVFVAGETFEYNLESGSSLLLQIDSLSDEATVTCAKYKQGNLVTIKKENLLGQIMSFTN